MSEDITNAGEILNKVVLGFRLEQESKKAFSVLDEWKRVLLRIQNSNDKYLGQNLCDHSHVVDLKNGILLVEVEHPGWISLIQFYKNFIIKGIKMDMPDLNIKNIVFRVKGSNAQLADVPSYSQETVKKNLEKRFEEEEKFNSSYKTQEKSQKKPEISADLAEVLNNLKQSMLTNSEI